MGISNQFKSKQLIVDVKVKTVDKHVPMPISMFLHSSRNSAGFAHWLAKSRIYNLYSVKTQKGWVVLFCPKDNFNRPPQPGMFIRLCKNKKQFEITGRNGR